MTATVQLRAAVISRLMFTLLTLLCLKLKGLSGNMIWVKAQSSAGLGSSSDLRTHAPMFIVSGPHEATDMSQKPVCAGNGHRVAIGVCISAWWRPYYPIWSMLVLCSAHPTDQTEKRYQPHFNTKVHRSVVVGCRMRINIDRSLQFPRANITCRWSILFLDDLFF